MALFEEGKSAAEMSALNTHDSSRPAKLSSTAPAQAKPIQGQI